MRKGVQFDAVLCLGGALSHVIEPSERVRALAQLQRVTRPDGLLFISVGNRLSSLRSAVLWPYTWDAARAEWERGGVSSLASGAPYYEFMPDEFVHLLEESDFELVCLFGCQGIAAHLPPDNLETLMQDAERWPAWHKLLLTTYDERTIAGLSCHLIAVVRPRGPDASIVA